MAERLAVVLPIPPELAEGWPDNGKTMPPHVTMVHVPEVDAAQVDDIALVVADELHARWSDLGRVTPGESVHDYASGLWSLGEFSIRFSGLRYFEAEAEAEAERVAYVGVSVPLDLGRARDRLVDRLLRLNIGISRAGKTWVPHATLAHLKSGEVYEGFVPEGEWTPETLEVWHGDDVRYLIGPGSASGVDKLERVGAKWVAYRNGGRVKVGEYASEAEAQRGLAEDDVDRRLTGRFDRLGRKGEKWVALSEDGTKEFGTYDTEAEARERLRQVEAAKAAKAQDAGVDFSCSAHERSDEDEDADMRACADACGVDLSDIEHRADRSDEEKAEIRSRWAKGEGPNMGAAGLRKWLDSPFAGPNRKSGDERARARRVANRALRIMAKSTEDWTDEDYTGALQIMAFIARMKDVAQGEPLVIDGREGPSARDASLQDWGYDPKRDRQDRQQVLFEPTGDGGLRVTLPLGAQVRFSDSPPSTARADAATAGIGSIVQAQRGPAVHTESRTRTEWITRADRITLPADHAPIVHPDGWVTYPVLYSRAGNIQVYGNVREFRPKDQVFDRASMDSGIGAPWELRHSADLLSPNTVRGVVRGTVLTVDEYHDGEHTFGWARAWDAALIHAIEGDGDIRPTAPDVSVAYRCRAHREPGTDDYGNQFDQWISDILWNSLASEPYGRAETSKVLGVRADAEPITVHGASELLALAQGGRPPAAPVVFDPGSWARFDAASTPRPEAPKSPRPPADQPNTRKDQHQMLKKLIKTAMALGMAEDAIATAIGVPADGLAAFLEGDQDLTPDQLNALVMALPDKPSMPSGDAEPSATTEAEAEAERVKVEIGDAEFMVPPAVAEEIAAMAAKAKADGEEMMLQKDRADRAAKRADSAEAELAKAEVELAKRADALEDMVPRADALVMAQEHGMRLAEAMELCRMGQGAVWAPEARKDASGAEISVGLDDWQRAAIAAAYGDRAENVLSRIDAAPTPEARSYAMDMRLADARGLLAERQHKSKDALAAITRMRDENARTDGHRNEDDDPVAAVDRVNKQYLAAPVGAQPQINGAA